MVPPIGRKRVFKLALRIHCCNKLLPKFMSNFFILWDIYRFNLESLHMFTPHILILLLLLPISSAKRLFTNRSTVAIVTKSYYIPIPIQ